MAAATFTGSATITFPSGTSWTGPTGATYHYFTDYSLKETRPITPLRDGAGNTLGFQVGPEGEKALDLTFVVRADTIAHGATADVLPTVNSKVTLASFSSEINGDWHYRDGATGQLSSDGAEKKFTLTVYQYPGCAKTVTQLTTAIV